jgi:Fe-S oxidoreductase
MHHTTFIEELVRSGRLKLKSGNQQAVTFHDPCYLGRHNGVYDAPRYALTAAGAALREMPRARHSSFCCGAGGAQFWKEEEHGVARVNLTRYAEAAATGAGMLAVGCPFCLRMFTDASQAGAVQAGPQVKDIAEIVAQNLGLDY